MRLIAFISSFFFFLQIALSQEGDLLDTPMKFLTFDQVKINLGASIEVGRGSMLSFIGEFPQNLELVTDSSFYLGATLLFDVSSPNSRLNFHFGAGWDWLALEFIENKSTIYEVNYNQLHFPFYLKYTFGKKWAAVNTIWFAGGTYNMPLKFSVDETTIPKNSILSYINVSSGLAIQANFRGKERNQSKAIVDGKQVTVNEKTPPRIWLYLKLAYSPLTTNFFNPNAKQSIIANYRSDELKYEDFRFSLGIANFFGSRKKNAIK